MGSERRARGGGGRGGILYSAEYGPYSGEYGLYSAEYFFGKLAATGGRERIPQRIPAHFKLISSFFWLDCCSFDYDCQLCM